MTGRSSRFSSSVPQWQMSSNDANNNTYNYNVWNNNNSNNNGGGIRVSSNVNNNNNNNYRTRQTQGLPNTDDEIDAYAQKVLEEYAASACSSTEEVATVVDDSLGAYVTNSIRRWRQEVGSSSTTTSASDITDMPEYQSLCELLQEQCSITASSIVRQAIESIAKAVFDKRIPSSTATTTTATAIQSLTESLSHGLQISTTTTTNSTSATAPTTVATNKSSIRKAQEDNDDEPNQQQSIDNSIISPLAADCLIPLDLLEEDPSEIEQQQQMQQVLEDRHQPQHYQEQQQNEVYDIDNSEEAFPPLSATKASNSSTINFRPIPKAKPRLERSGGSKSKGYVKADDLAAVLFRHHPRSRQSSIDESLATSSSTSPNLQSSHYPNGSTPPPTANIGAVLSYNGTGTNINENGRSNNTYHDTHSQPNIMHPDNNGDPQLYDGTDQQQEDLMMMIQNCSEVLLSINPELSMPAALAASDMCHGAINAAQYLINAAATAPPICRHLLNAGCYRADCQFSHEIDSHTCIFWLKGRCSRQYDNTTRGLNSTNACRFLHGFHPKLVNEIPAEYFVISQEQQQQQHDFMGYANSDVSSMMIYGQQEHYGATDGVYSTDGYDYSTDYSNNRNMNSLYEDYATSSWGGPTPTPTSVSAPNSFANIASQGYNRNQSYNADVTGALTTSRSSSMTSIDIRTLPTAKIPQDLWNPHENRDAAAFHIPDPLERYYYVKNTTQSREDVIDLHFQSLKTFPIVLDVLLEELEGQHLRSNMVANGGIWIVTGTGHHVGTQTHQRGGGALENAVLQYLVDHYSNLYAIYRGRDRNGQGGAILIVPRIATNR